MNYEYLIFNMVILAGPLALSFDRKVAYYKKWGPAMTATLLSLVPFIIWDMLVTGRHWHFNESYTLPLRILGLPLSEWLFFIIVPFACIFVWEVLDYYLLKPFRPKDMFWVLAPIFLVLAIITLFNHKEYTALALFAMSLVMVLDRILKTGIFVQKQSGLFFGILAILVLVFNGYLTGRPVVLYNNIYNLGWRVITIPVEDFFYGISHIALALIIYEKIKGHKGG